MRTLDQARTSWQVLKTISDAKGFHDSILVANIAELESRSIYWKARRSSPRQCTTDLFQVFLLFEKVDHTLWLRKLGDSRSAYVSLRGNLLRAIDHPDEIDTGEDPLSEDTASPWKTIRHDGELRAEIMQDVERCCPEHTYFRLERTHEMMLDILFIFCKLNPDVGYRQGMHELLAPILWVVECDAIQNGSKSKQDFMICQLCDSRFIEHDAFTLFCVVMQNAKHFYEQKAHRRQASHTQQKSSGQLENPILTIINRVFDDYLQSLDPELSTHLKTIDLVPQVFLIRWIRLLFGREFPFDSVLPLWDVIFASDPTLDLVEMISLVMLLRVRWSLLSSDHDECLALLLRYPSLPPSTQPRDLALEALSLRSSFTPATVTSLVERHTGRTPNLPVNPATVPTSPIPSRPATHSRSPSALIQNAAKDVLRNTRWNLNATFLSAVEEVRRGVRDMQTVPTPSSPSRRGHTRFASQPGNGRNSAAERRVVELTLRNERLAGMLKETVRELWEVQRVVSETAERQERTGPDVVDRLGVGIAKVGFVQVYLEDAGMVLPTEEEEAAAEEDVTAQTAAAGTTAAQPNDPPSAPTSTPPPPPKPAPLTKAPGAAPISTQEPRPTTPPPLDADASRPALAQSSFSWMLGQGERSSSPSSSPLAAVSDVSSAGRPRSRGFLFGDDDDDDEEQDEERVVAGEREGQGGGLMGTPTRKAKGRKIVRMGGGGGLNRRNMEGGDDGFDLHELKSG